MALQVKALFAPKVIRFVILTVVRLVGIVAICLVIGAELSELVNNIKGYVKAVHDTTPSTSNSTAIANAANSTSGAFASATSLFAGDVEARQSFRQACGYVEGTSVPDHAGGILFSSLFRFLNVLVLFFLLVSELSIPWAPLTNFYLRYFPPLSEDFSTSFLGAAMLWVSASILSTHVSRFAMIAAWFLFVTGVLNVLLSLIMGANVRVHRSVMESDKSLRPELPMFNNAAKVNKKGKVSYPAPADIGEIGYPTPAYGVYNNSRTSMSASEFGIGTYSSHGPVATGPLTRPSEMLERRAGSPIGVSRTRSGKGILKIRTPAEEEEEEQRAAAAAHTPPSYAH